MQRRERVNNMEEVIRAAFEGLQSGIYTAFPGIVDKVEPQYKMTVNVKVAIHGRSLQKNGTYTRLESPLLLDCPIVWTGGGGVTLTFPITAGDEALVIIASRCIDNWFIKGGVQDPYEFRMHDLSDGFALVGVRSQPRAYAIPTQGARLTADDGHTYVQLDPTGQTVNVVAPGGINLNGFHIDSNGNTHTAGTMTADTDVVTAGVSEKGHKHTDPQGGLTGVQQ